MRAVNIGLVTLLILKDRSFVSWQLWMATPLVNNPCFFKAKQCPPPEIRVPNISVAGHCVCAIAAAARSYWAKQSSWANLPVFERVNYCM